MVPAHFVRIGVLGHVGRFVAADRTIYAAGKRVICRTRRGLEIGEVMRGRPTSTFTSESDGSLLRAVTVEDDLLVARLEKNRNQAYEACVSLLQVQGLNATLMDVEQLFDGSSLYFYFLGEVTPEIEKITQQLAETYETKVQFREFVDAVERGCGPDCGTEDAAGCGSSCSSCSIASACKK
jgi:cell fate regulator YaaT (PSP1 superfamily)